MPSLPLARPTRWRRVARGLIDASPGPFAAMLRRVRASPHTRDAVFRGVANAYGCVVQLAALLVASVAMPADQYATYMLALATIGIAELGVDFGGRTWGIRQFARRQQSVWEVFILTARLRLGFSAATAVAIGTAVVGEIDIPAPVLCLLIALTQPATDPLTWLLHGRARFDIEVAILIGYWTTLASTVAAVALLDGRTTLILGGWLTCNLLRLAIQTFLPCTQRLLSEDPPSETVPLPAWRTAVCECVPMGAALLLAGTAQYVGVFALAWTDTTAAVALFGTAHRLSSRTRFVAQNVATAFFPRLVAGFEANNTTAMNGVLSSKLKILTALFAPACLAGIALLPLLASWVWDGELEQMGNVLVLMAPGVFLAAINVGNRYVLNVVSLNWVEVACHAVGTVAFIAFLLVPLGQSAPHQAAVAWVVSETVVYAVRAAAFRRSGLPVDLRVVRTLGVFAALSIAAAARVLLSIASA